MLNLTQHNATPEQIAAGVVNAPEEYAGQIRDMLTFDSLPTRREIDQRAAALADLAAIWSADDDYQYSGLDVMIGGAPFLMSALESALMDLHLIPHYAFSERKSAEQIQDDGSVRKVNVFQHLGFVRAS